MDRLLGAGEGGGVDRGGGVAKGAPLFDGEYAVVPSSEHMAELVLECFPGGRTAMLAAGESGPSDSSSPSISRKSALTFSNLDLDVVAIGSSASLMLFKDSSMFPSNVATASRNDDLTLSSDNGSSEPES